ncbi:MAG: MFS transporter [Candidatus Promineifilaceae bacterium]
MAASLHNISDQEYKKRIRAWTLYDWANSAFATTILAAVLPVYYSGVAGSTLPSAAKATQYWSITLSISVLIVAFLSPVLGTVSDIMRGKKRFLSIFMMLGVIGTGLLFFVQTGDWLMASIFFVIGRVGFGASTVFYDSLLPHIAREDDQDRVSSLGYAVGYLGGGILLAINVVMIFTLGGGPGSRWSFLTVAIWWAVFSIPILRNVPEPAGSGQKLEPGQNIWTVGFTQAITTLRNISKYKQLFRYLVGFLIYNDAINIVISVAAIYGAELGFASTELILAILLVQFVGMPYAIVFGNLPSKSNARQAMYVAFIVFNIISLPLVGITGTYLLPNSITGTPSPAFADSATAAGEGVQSVSGQWFETAGDWTSSTLGPDSTGLEESVDFVNSSAENEQLNFRYNGQKAKITYASGPEFGIWAIEVDGAPLLDADGQPTTVDAYNATVRYDDSIEVIADAEGEHVLSLINLGQMSADASGSNMSISQVEVLPPIRTSNLGAILGVLVATVLVGAIFAWITGPRLFTGLAESLDTKRSIMLALVAYSLIAIWGFFLNSVIEFWFLAWMVATVQGGSQALSRSLYASMTPNRLSGEFFGFFSIMSKFASFLSPLVFVASVALFNSSRPGVLSLIVFFIIGMYLLNTVNVEEGKAYAQQKDAELAAAGS